MKVAIVGYRVEGRISAEYWRRLGHDITICDIDTNLKIPKKYYSRLGSDYLKNLNDFDLIVRTAGLNPRKILAENPDSPNIKGKITTSLNEFLTKCPSVHTIGVTGTKGKGTTSTLIAKLLEAQGKTVHLGGNIGIAPLKMLPKVKKTDWVVLELSSFQLSDIKIAPHIAVCLMVVPEHLDWHKDLEDYTTAKAKLFALQRSADKAVYYSGNELSRQIAGRSPGKKVPYDKAPGAFVREDGMILMGYNHHEVIHKSRVKLLGEHNLQNICAALTTVHEALGSVDKAEVVLSSFKGLGHRLELVRELEGVKYYDDSFGTTPETAIVAMRAVSGPKVLVLGGSDKGAIFEELTDEVATQDIRQVIAIGKTGPAIARLLREKGYNDIIEGLNNMPAIVRAARKAARSGDSVLLSTGCASFGLFKDYKDRGNQFKSAVKNLV